MSFNDLPPSILLSIASELEKVDILSRYATINRPWNSVVEALTFRELRSESIRHLRQFPEYLNSDRWKAFRSFDVIIQLPEYTEEQWWDFETDQDKEINDAVFSDSLKEVFTIIDSWKVYRSGASRMSLAIQAISKSDYWHLTGHDRVQRGARCGPFAQDTRFEASYLHLNEELPCLPIVSNLIIRGAHVRRRIGRKSRRSCCPRRISGETASRIIRACPEVDKVELELSDEESRNPKIRNAERSAFARSLFDLPRTMTHLRLSYPGVVPRNQTFDPPAVPLERVRDLLSCRLNNVTQQLQTLDMRAVLSEDFFSILDPTTSWPQLRTLRIDLDPCTPAGDWMLEVDPTDTDVEDFDTDEEETYEYAIEEGLYRYETEYPARMHLPRRSFRTAVNPDILNDMYLAVARAMTRMPNLRDLKLNVETQCQESGCLCTFTSDRRSSHKVVWQSRSATMYEPHEDVIAAWEQVFAERTGELEIQVL